MKILNLSLTNLEVRRRTSVGDRHFIELSLNSISIGSRKEIDEKTSSSGLREVVLLFYNQSSFDEL
jgi:hypothetical protein